MEELYLRESHANNTHTIQFYCIGVGQSENLLDFVNILLKELVKAGAEVVCRVV